MRTQLPVHFVRLVHGFPVILDLVSLLDRCSSVAQRITIAQAAPCSQKHLLIEQGMSEIVLPPCNPC